jgi:hypothetical protein
MSDYRKTKEAMERELKFHSDRFYNLNKYYTDKSEYWKGFHEGNMNALAWSLGRHDERELIDIEKKAE